MRMFPICELDADMLQCDRCRQRKVRSAKIVPLGCKASTDFKLAQ